MSSLGPMHLVPLTMAKFIDGDVESHRCEIHTAIVA